MLQAFLGGGASKAGEQDVLKSAVMVGPCPALPQSLPCPPPRTIPTSRLLNMLHLYVYPAFPTCSQDFEWSPAEPLLAAYTQEVGDRPASISIVKIPERSAVRSKQLFNVSGECCVGCARWLSGGLFEAHANGCATCAGRARAWFFVGPGEGGGQLSSCVRALTSQLHTSCIHRPCRMYSRICGCM